MATGRPTTTNNRAAQQAKLRRAKSGKRRAAHNRTTRKHLGRTQMGGVAATKQTSIVFPNSGETNTEPELEQPQIDVLRASLAELQKQRADILAEINTHNASEEEYKKIEAELAKLQTEYDASVTEYNTRHTEYSKAMKELNKEQEELLMLSQKNIELEATKRTKQEEFAGHLQKFEETQKQMKKLLAEQAKLDNDIAELEQQIKNLEDLANAEPKYENWPPTTNQKHAMATTDDEYKFNELDSVEDTLKKNFKEVSIKYVCGNNEFTCVDASSDDNKPKNRYGNILAYDQTRVKLAGERVSDYINANYITLGNRHYIATQGPKDNTIEDFWDMIIQERPNVICMVTGFVELKNNEPTQKCAYYFGVNEGAMEVAKNADTGSTTNLKIGKYNITTEKLNKKGNNIEERLITISDKLGNVIHTLTHLWYTAWQDHGVPKNTMDMIELSKKLDEFTATNYNSIDREGKPVIDKTNAPPPVVHCSAGVGRTGTIIAINHLLSLEPTFEKITHGTNPREVKLGNTNKLLTLMLTDLESMRKQRTTMIQEVAQYYCVFETVKDFYENSATQKEYQKYKLSQNAYSLNQQKPMANTTGAVSRQQFNLRGNAVNETGDEIYGSIPVYRQKPQRFPVAEQPDPDEDLPPLPNQAQLPQLPKQAQLPTGAEGVATAQKTDYEPDEQNQGYKLTHYTSYGRQDQIITADNIKGDKIIYLEYNSYNPTDQTLEFTLGKATRQPRTNQFKIDSDKQYHFSYYINIHPVRDQVFTVNIIRKENKDFININYGGINHQLTSKYTTVILTAIYPTLNFSKAKEVISKVIKAQEKQIKRSYKSYGGAVTLTKRTKRNQGSSKGTRKRHITHRKITQKSRQTCNNRKNTMKSGKW